MKVIWTDKAEQDRLEIFDYIAGFDEGAAERMKARFAEWERKRREGAA